MPFSISTHGSDFCASELTDQTVMFVDLRGFTSICGDATADDVGAWV